jgi:hypothetical protein
MTPEEFNGSAKPHSLMTNVCQHNRRFTTYGAWLPPREPMLKQSATWPLVRRHQEVTLLSHSVRALLPNQRSLTAERAIDAAANRPSRWT